jgi:hypothetical protein
MAVSPAGQQNREKSLQSFPQPDFAQKCQADDQHSHRQQADQHM